MAPRPPRTRRLVSFLFSEAAIQAFWTYAFPPLFGLATAALGLAEREPLMWILAASAMAFAMMSLGLLAFGQWRFRRSAEHKLLFVRLMVNRGQVEGAERIVLGIVMKNAADFPLEVSLIKLTTAVAARIPITKIQLPRTMRVDATSDFYFTDNAIDISGVTVDTMPGSIEAEFQYGRPSGQVFTVGHALTVSIPLETTKPFLASAVLTPNEQPGSAQSS